MAQQMGAGVKTHQPVAPRPVEASDHRLAHSQLQGRRGGLIQQGLKQVGGWHMANLTVKAAVFGLAFAGVDDGYLLAIGELQYPGIPSLATA